MAQHSWNITGPMGKTYNLSLFHGDTTHHVVVHCNNNIVVIDFGVKESKTYSLFLDQELCEVTIDHTGDDTFSYDCKINHDVQTPLNLQRQKYRDDEDRLERVHVFAACAAVFVIVMVFLIA